MSFPDHYQITERTRFRVRYEIHPGREFAAPGVYWLRGFETVEDCQRAYIAARQASGLGASQFGEGNLFDQAGQHLARISYNGRLWSPVPWHSGLAPLAEAPEITPQEDRTQRKRFTLKTRGRLGCKSALTMAATGKNPS